MQRSLALSLLLLGCTCSLLSGIAAQPAAAPACKVDADCKTNGTTCCSGVCIDPAKQECLSDGEVCDKASVCTAGTFIKSCCPYGTQCINGQCGVQCGKGDCQTFCPAVVSFCTNGQCVNNGPLCEFPDGKNTNLDTNFYPCARGYNCTDQGKTESVGCCPAAQACGPADTPANTTCCAAGSTCNNNECVPGVVAAIACADGQTKIGGSCCPNARVCGKGPYQSCCAADRTCALGQCVLPATADDSETASKLCGETGVYCASGSICLNGTCVLEAATCGGTCCADGTVCVLTTTGPVCCKSQNACGRLGLDREGVRHPQSCCATGSDCLPSGLCSGAKVLGTNSTNGAPASGAFNMTTAIDRANNDRTNTPADGSPPIPLMSDSASPSPSPSPSLGTSPGLSPAPAMDPAATENPSMDLMTNLFGSFGR